MAVVQDALTQELDYSGAFDHTPVGTPTAVVIRISGRGATDGTTNISGVTYGGVACTKKILRSHTGSTTTPGSSRWVEIWTLESPASGTKSVAATNSGTEARDLQVTCTTYTGTPTTGQYGTPQGDWDNNSVTSTSGITLTSETGGLCVDALVTGADGENHTADSGQSEDYDVDTDAAATTRSCGSEEAGATSVSMGWSWTTSAVFALVGIPLAPVPNRSAIVTAFEFEVGDAARAAQVSAYELEVPTAPRTARVHAFELEVPNAPRAAQVTAFEFETEDAARTALVTAFELETEDAGRTARVQAFEFEVGDAGRTAIVSAYELETEDAARQAQITAFELEAPAATELEGYRWRDDDNTEALATWLAGQDADIVRAINTNTRLRTLINASGDPATAQATVQFRKVGDAEWQTVT